MATAPPDLEQIGMIGRGHIIQLKAKAVAGRQLHDLKHLKGEGPMATAVSNTAGRGRRRYWLANKAST